jgi:hypothetical protein
MEFVRPQAHNTVAFPNGVMPVGALPPPYVPPHGADGHAGALFNNLLVMRIGGAAKGLRPIPAPAQMPRFGPKTSGS